MFNRQLFAKTPILLKLLYPNLTWNFSRNTKKIYLTFDDGPTEGVTESVLEILASYNAKATFFCVGQQVERNTKIFQQIINEGHAVGNHTYSHKKGWKTKNEDYYQEVKKTSELVNTKLFRPPYGKISRKQISYLSKDFKIIMWDVLSYDYDKTLSNEICYKNVINNAKNGSIIVFHDSKKAQENVLPTLTRVLKYYSAKGFSFEKIGS